MYVVSRDILETWFIYIYQVNFFLCVANTSLHDTVGMDSGPDQAMVSQMLEEALGSDEQSVTKDRSK